MKIKLKSLFVGAGAEFSCCRHYRYDLWRSWDASKPTALFIMLNPSTADELVNDPTVERCQVRASRMGFGTLHVANIFAWRSTDPRKLYEIHDPVGRHNDAHIARLCLAADLIVCGWGTHGKFNDRGAEVVGMIYGMGKVPHALKINGDGTPAHPLYLPYSLKPLAMKG